MRTWIKNTLIAALGASVALGGMAFASNVRDGCGWHSHGPMSEADSAKFREKMVDRATSVLELDATQRQHLVALGETLHAQRQNFMPGGTHPREQLQGLIAGERFDAALVVNGANALFLPILGAAGVPTALNVDGIEKRRAKWGRFGRAVYALSERLATFLPDALVTDAEVIRRHYEERYDAPSTPIAYGVDPRPLTATGLLRRLGVESRKYLLYVSRFEPENNPHRVVEAYRRVGGTTPLVMVGGAPYADRFIAGLRAAADDRVRFPGAIYGRGYRQLLSHALAYVHATEVGGTHPALIEAMGSGNCVVVNDVPENREVAGDAAEYFDARRPASLAATLERLARDPARVAELGERAMARARTRFSWEHVTDEYEQLFARLRTERRVAA